jgi:tRNA dimethylallyltransferase
VHRILVRLDPYAATQVHPNDIPKVIRAVEVCFATREKMSVLWKRGRDALQGFRFLRIGLSPDREALYQRINERAITMFESGLIEETRTLWEKYGLGAGALSSLGYKQALQCLRGELGREQAIQAAQQAHRNYAKRQMTWFRREPDVTWLSGFGHEAAIQKQAESLVLGHQVPDRV